MVFRRAVGKDHDNDTPPHDRSIAKYTATWDEHLALWNGPFSGPGGDNRRIHVYVKDGTDTEDYLKRMSQSFVKVHLKLTITKPEHGKWTNITPALEQVFLAESNSGMFEHLVEAASNKFDLTISRQQRNHVELKFNKVTYQAMKEVKEIAANMEHQISHAICAILLERQKVATCFF